MNNSERFRFENAGEKKHQDIMDRNKTFKKWNGDPKQEIWGCRPEI